ncbi:formate/nitrite transporter family protein [Pseudarthrobacter sp. AL07]|uniref:formate/nitrite transporter family protein n=1 Tax=unclassified Pseudarthrobacter TaxID=2647000 RepID=UPI00249A5771|nr:MULTISPECIES: formate/nitrite transporter family protein [unclassified Pseudarthrobacter]MDI3194422.1 formate/nitrite transporter family protein [Pseudarthrobacter sp. AL20]MDI3208489.1 formate/nitrite transporter family protein [Pseudarthrobacter sp. AL07]
MSDTDGDARRRELGDNPGPVEEEVEESFDRTVEEGAQRLNRNFRDVLITGLFGGFEIGVGIMAYLGVLYETGNHLLAGLAFSAGLIALLLAKSELFTEGFLVPIAAVVAREASYVQLGKLWGGTLIANLVGGWLFMALIMTAFPQWNGTITKEATYFLDAGFSWKTVCLAVLAGSTITLMTRMQHGTDSVTGKIAAAVVGAFLLYGLQLFHSILDSLLIFGAIHAGADIDYLQWLGWFSYVVVFNMLGGILLVTALRLVSARKLLKERRDGSPEDPEDAHHAG